MDVNDDIIGLLNDIGVGKVKDEIFIDGSGEPTDLFLQALKSEFPRSKPARATKGGIHEEKSEEFEETSSHSRQKQPVTSVTQTIKSKSEGTIRSRSLMKVPKPSRNGPSTSTGKRKKHTTSRTRSPTREEIRGSVDAGKLVVNRKPAIEVRNSRAAEKRINYGAKHADEAQKLSVERSTGKGIAFTARQDTSKDKVPPSSPKRTKSSQEAASALLMKTRSLRHDGEEDPLEYYPGGEDASEVDAKLKTQQLRIAGQVQTIKALEAQLGETMETLAERTRQLAHADSRVKAMHKELQRETRRASERVQENTKILESRRGDLLEKFKAQNDLLVSQLSEEQAKGRRANDRVRVLREFGDKLKDKVAGLETREEELTKSLADANKSLQRLRHDNRQLSQEAASQRGINAEREEELGRQRARADSAEYSVRNLQMDNERMAEEIRMQRRDLFSSQEQVKQARLEMEIHRQKSATRHTEDVINAMRSRGGRATDMMEHRSNHYRHTHEGHGLDEKEGEPTLPAPPTEEPRRQAHSKPPSSTPAQSRSPQRRAAAGRVVKPHYTLPSRPQGHVQGQSQPLGSRTSLTAMSRRARASPGEKPFLEEDYDREEEEERRGSLLPHSKVSMPPPAPTDPVRASWGNASQTSQSTATELEEILGLETDEDDDEGEEAREPLSAMGEHHSLEEDLAHTNLRHVSESIQARARGQAKKAEDSLRSSIESMGSELAQQDLNDLSHFSQGSSVEVLQDRMNKLMKLQERY